jgi:hypothetical protein
MRKSDAGSVSSFIDPGAIGKLKIEDTYERLRINGLKDYETEKGITLKGIPKRAREVAPRVYEYDFFPRQRTHLIKRIDRWHIISRMRKAISGKYTKGTVGKDGRVSPLIFPDALGKGAE